MRFITLALALLISTPALAVDGLVVPATVISVYDGDTFTVEAENWPGHWVHIKIRVLGMDTPEIKTKCKSEKAMGYVTRDFAADVLGDQVILKNIKLGSFAGRVLADVYLIDGRSFADVMISNGLARVYDGGKREGWCE